MKMNRMQLAVDDYMERSSRDTDEDDADIRASVAHDHGFSLDELDAGIRLALVGV